jgi:hypothetical protein
MPEPKLGAQLQSKYKSLGSCVSCAQQLCSRLGAALEAAADAYEASLADQQLSPPRRGHPAAAPGPSSSALGLAAGPAAAPGGSLRRAAEPPQLEQASAPPQAEAPGDAADAGSSAAASGGAAAPQQEELLFVAQALQGALRRELQLMARVAKAVALDTPAEELGSYATLWELQPFLQAEGLAAALSRLQQPARAAAASASAAVAAATGAA